MALTRVDLVAALPPGSRRRIQVGPRWIALFNVDGAFFAIADRCPHQGASLCAGDLGCDVSAPTPGDYRSDPARPLVRCPWHGWEFDLRTGRSRCEPERIRVRSYETVVLGPDTAPPPAAETFPVVIEGDTVFVDA